MTNSTRKFSWNRILAGLKDFWRQEPGKWATGPLRGSAPDHMPYIEVMLPVTGVVTPVTFGREPAHKNSSPRRLG